MSLMTTFSTTLLDLVVFLTNLISFHRLDAMHGVFHGNAPPDILMNLFLVHKILARLIFATDDTPLAGLGLGSRNNETQTPNQSAWPW